MPPTSFTKNQRVKKRRKEDGCQEVNLFLFWPLLPVYLNNGDQLRHVRQIDGGRKAEKAQLLAKLPQLYVVVSVVGFANRFKDDQIASFQNWAGDLDADLDCAELLLIAPAIVLSSTFLKSFDRSQSAKRLFQ